MPLANSTAPAAAEGSNARHSCRRTVERRSPATAALLLRAAAKTPGDLLTEEEEAGEAADAVRGAHRQAQRLLDHCVPAAAERVFGQGVVHARRGRYVDSCDIEGGQLAEGAHNSGARAEEGRGLVGERLGVGAHGVAGADEGEAAEAGAVQLGQPEEVAVAHAAAAYDRERDASHLDLPNRALAARSAQPRPGGAARPTAPWRRGPTLKRRADMRSPFGAAPLRGYFVKFHKPAMEAEL